MSDNVCHCQLINDRGQHWSSSGRHHCPSISRALRLIYRFFKDMLVIFSKILKIQSVWLFNIFRSITPQWWLNGAILRLIDFSHRDTH